MFSVKVIKKIKIYYKCQLKQKVKTLLKERKKIIMGELNKKSVI